MKDNETDDDKDLPGEDEECDERCAEHHPNCDGYCSHENHINGCQENPPAFPMR